MELEIGEPCYTSIKYRRTLLAAVWAPFVAHSRKSVAFASATNCPSIISKSLTSIRFTIEKFHPVSYKTFNLKPPFINISGTYLNGQSKVDLLSVVARH